LGKQEIEYQFDDEGCWYGGRVSKVSDCSRPPTDTRSAQLKRPGWIGAAFDDGDIRNIKLRTQVVVERRKMEMETSQGAAARRRPLAFYLIPASRLLFTASSAATPRGTPRTQGPKAGAGGAVRRA
jgi:hypothetical protein